MHPPLAMQTEEIKVMGKHCTTVVDFRIFHGWVILLDSHECIIRLLCELRKSKWQSNWLHVLTSGYLKDELESMTLRDASSACYTNWGNQSSKALYCRCRLRNISWTSYTPWCSRKINLFCSLQLHNRTVELNISLLIFSNVLQLLYNPSIVIGMLRLDRSSCSASSITICGLALIMFLPTFCN